MNIILIILVFGVIVFFHEFGHFIVAKMNKIAVMEFSIGMGPAIFSIQKKETKYSLRLLPIGGYCMMMGEDGESEDENAFNNKPLLARILVIAAGPVFNFILAFLLALIVIGAAGFDRPEVKGVMEGYPAEEAGLQAGDIIKEINGKNIHIYREVSVYTLFHSNENLEVTYERDGEEYTCTISPKYNEEAGRNLFGIYGNTVRERGNLFETIKYSAYEVKYWIEVTMDSLKMLVTGRVSVNELSGPVGIVKNIGDTYDESKAAGTLSVVLTLINYSIMLTANLGIMNLLPLPALDGGRLVFLIIEAIRKKRVDPDKEGMVHFIGLMLLLALMVLVMFNDIRKLF